MSWTDEELEQYYGDDPLYEAVHSDAAMLSDPGYLAMSMAAEGNQDIWARQTELRRQHRLLLKETHPQYDWGDGTHQPKLLNLAPVKPIPGFTEEESRDEQLTRRSLPPPVITDIPSGGQ